MPKIVRRPVWETTEVEAWYVVSDAGAFLSGPYDLRRHAEIDAERLSAQATSPTGKGVLHEVGNADARARGRCGSRSAYGNRPESGRQHLGTNAAGRTD